MRTTEDLRRQDIKELFNKVLKEEKVKISPISILIREQLEQKHTIVDFTFEVPQSLTPTVYSFDDARGKGFVDALFTATHAHFIEDYNSLSNLSLLELIVKPIFSMSEKDSKSDAKTDVIVRVQNRDHGVSEFSYRSSSIINASFRVILEIFQFYINCDKSFKKLKLFLEDAQSRNRGDTTQEIIADLSRLTTVNTYA